MMRDGFFKLIDGRGYRRAAEVGVGRGDFSVSLLKNTKLSTLYSIDNWEVAPKDDCRKPMMGTKVAMYTAEKRLAQFGNRSIIKRVASFDAASMFPLGYFDFVYIDAGHDYTNVRQDIVAWWPLVRHGGILAGHDYGSRNAKGYRRRGLEVIRAVDELARFFKCDVFVTNEASVRSIPSWWYEKI